MYKMIMFALFMKQKKKKISKTEWLNKLYNEILK